MLCRRTMLCDAECERRLSLANIVIYVSCLSGLYQSDDDFDATDVVVVVVAGYRSRRVSFFIADSRDNDLAGRSIAHLETSPQPRNGLIQASDEATNLCLLARFDDSDSD